MKKKLTIREMKAYLESLINDTQSSAIFIALILNCNRLLMCGHDENEIYEDIKT